MAKLNGIETGAFLAEPRAETGFDSFHLENQVGAYRQETLNQPHLCQHSPTPKSVTFLA